MVGKLMMLKNMKRRDKGKGSNGQGQEGEEEEVEGLDGQHQSTRVNDNRQVTREAVSEDSDSDENSTIDEESIKSHLRVLRIFHSLLKIIQSFQSTSTNTKNNSKQVRTDDQVENLLGESDERGVEASDTNNNNPQAYPSLNQFLHFSLFRFELWVGRIGDHIPTTRINYSSHLEGDYDAREGRKPREKTKRKKKCTEEERSNRKKGSGDISDGSSNPSIEIADEFLPPLDVLWVWYCYCFRSRAYYEDSLRSYPVLNSLRFPIKSIISNYSDLDPQKFLKDKRKFRVLPNVLRWTPTDGSEDDDDEHKTINQRKNNYEIDDEDRTRIDSMIKNWFALTNTEFDPIGFYLNPTLRTTICPSCDDCIEKSFFTSKKVNKSIKRVLNEEKGKEELIEVFEEQLDIGWSEEKTPTLFPSVSSTILHLQNSTNQQSASSSSKFASLDPSKRSHQSCRLSCTNCNWSGTKEELGIYKFLRDLQSALIFIIKSDRPLNHVLVKTITNYTRSTSRTNKTSTTDTTLKTNNSSNNQSHNNSSTTTANKNSNGSSSSYHTSNSSTNCDKRYETYREEEEVEADDREGEDLQDNLEFSECVNESNILSNCLCGTLTTEESLIDKKNSVSFNKIFLSTFISPSSDSTAPLSPPKPLTTVIPTRKGRMRFKKKRSREELSTREDEQNRHWDLHRRNNSFLNNDNDDGEGELRGLDSDLKGHEQIRVDEIFQKFNNLIQPNSKNAKAARSDSEIGEGDGLGRLRNVFELFQKVSNLLKLDSAISNDKTNLTLDEICYLKDRVKQRKAEEVERTGEPFEKDYCDSKMNKRVETNELMRVYKKCFNRVLIGYSVPEPFSVDLIQSMKCSIGFIEKIIGLGWTLEIEKDNSKNKNTATSNANGKVFKKGKDDEGRSILEFCIARYNAFVDLALVMPKDSIPIPTFDIDLAWRTDRLRGIKYVESMFKWNKRLIDHPSELGLDRATVINQFNLTSSKWIEKYRIGYSRYQVPYISIPRKPVWLKQVLKKSMVSNGSSAVKFLIKNNDIDTVEKNHGIDQQFDNSNSNHNRQFDKLQQRKIGNLDDDESLKTPRSRLRPEIRINDDNDDSKNEFKPIFVTRADCLDSKHDQGGLYPVKKPEIRNVIEESDLMSEDPELAEELEEKMEIKRAKVEKIQLANFKARPIQSSVQLKTPTDPKNMSMRFETKANDKLEIRDEFTGQRCINNSNNNSSMDQRSGVGDQKVKQKSTSLSSSISSSPPTSKSFVDSKDDRISKTALGISSLTRTYSSNRKHCRNLQQPQQQPRSTKNTTTELKEDEMKIIAQQKQQQGVAKKTMNTMIITEASFKSSESLSMKVSDQRRDKLDKAENEVNMNQKQGQPNILADDLIKNQKLLHRQDSVDEITKKSEGQGKQEKDLIGQDGKEELKSKGNINDNKESKKSQREPESGVNRDRDRYRTNDKSDEYEGVVDEEEVVDDEEDEGEDGINENFIIEIPIGKIGFVEGNRLRLM